MGKIVRIKPSREFYDNISPRTLDYLKTNPLNEIEFNVDKKECCLLFNQDRIPKPVQIDIQNHLLRNNDLISRVKFCANKKTTLNLEQYLNKNYDNILLQIKQQFPSLQGWLAFTKWKLKSNNLIIEVKSKFAVSFLYNRNIPTAIYKIIKKDIPISSLKIEIIEGDFSEKVNKINKEILSSTEKAVEKQTEYDFSDQSSQKVSIDFNKLKNKVLYGREIKGEPIEMQNISGYSENQQIITKGKVIEFDHIDLSKYKFRSKNSSNANNIFSLLVTDYTNSIYCKIFTNKTVPDLSKTNIIVKGKFKFDKFGEEFIDVNSINLIDIENPVDSADEKRVELHLHSKMSKMDALTDVEELVERLKRWGHKAVALTDHGTVHNFPDFYSLCKKNDIKPILGVESYLVDDIGGIVKNSENLKNGFDNNYIYFDINVTGPNFLEDSIINIQAIKCYKEKIIDSLDINFDDLDINQLDLEDSVQNKNFDKTDIKLEIRKRLEKFLTFCGDSILVSTNTENEISFIKHNLPKAEINNCYLDLRPIFVYLMQDIKLPTIYETVNFFNLDISDDHIINRHYEVQKIIFEHIIKYFKKKNILKNNISELNAICHDELQIKNKTKNPHVVIYVKNQKGLKHLYEILSIANLKYQKYGISKVPKSLLSKNREGLIITSACEAGEVYQSVLRNDSIEKTKKIMAFYDYIELQPIENNKFLLNLTDNKINNIDDLKDINKKIYLIASELKKRVVATGDVHFLEPKDEIYRRLILYYLGMRDHADKGPDLSLKTTESMLEEFSYLGTDTAKEIVITNPNFLTDSIGEVKPIPDGFYPPEIENAEDMIKKLVYDNAKNIYGKNLPEIVEKRIEKELNSIITHKFSNLYILAHKVVKKAIEDGCLVGSRGSVGSSFVAFLLGITDVNALAPHYVCPKCKISDFNIDKKYNIGPDLPDKKCSKCNANLIKDGYNIFFEVFLGFKGDKIPDIDLNFPGNYQPVIHQYVKDMFGEENVIRAGTISTIAKGYAKIIAKKYIEENNFTVRKAELIRLSKGCLKVKKTTGQHPGGLVIIPKNKSVYDFCPVERPGGKADNENIITHFDYHKMEAQLIKLDLLGQDDPTQLLLLKKYTGVDLNKIPFNDPKTMELFSNTSCIGVSPNQLGAEVATYAVPEFGTNFVQKMLVVTRPKTTEELIRISGLSHGTDVWKNNAEDIIKSGRAKLSQVISARDDIMLYLINKGIPDHISFKIMEAVRKGKGIPEEYMQILKDNKIPPWYIKSCNKIKYLFPKAHAVAYVIMAYKIAYFKIHYPVEFYASYITIKSENCDLSFLMKNQKEIAKDINEIKKLKYSATAKDKVTMSIMEVIREMKLRNIEIEPVDIHESEVSEAVIKNNKILPPLITVDSLGIKLAENIIKERKKRPFKTIEDFIDRCRANKNVRAALREFGCYRGLPESEQRTLF